MLPDLLSKSGNTRCHPKSEPVPVMTNHDEHPEMQGQAQKKRKTERQGQAQQQAAGVRPEFEEDEVNDDPPEGPNFDTRPWFWALRLGGHKRAQIPMPPLENAAAQHPKGARLPSVGLVLFVEAMTDLIGQLNTIGAEEWKPESIERIKQVPTELQTKLNETAFMIKDMSWQSFVTAVETYGPGSKQDTWLSYDKMMDDSGPDIIELTTD